MKEAIVLLALVILAGAVVGEPGAVNNQQSGESCSKWKDGAKDASENPIINNQKLAEPNLLTGATAGQIWLDLERCGHKDLQDTPCDAKQAKEGCKKYCQEECKSDTTNEEIKKYWQAAFKDFCSKKPSAEGCGIEDGTLETNNPESEQCKWKKTDSSIVDQSTQCKEKADKDCKDEGCKSCEKDIGEKKHEAVMPGYAEQTVNKACEKIDTTQGSAETKCPCGQQCEAGINKKVQELGWLKGLGENNIDEIECFECINKVTKQLTQETDAMCSALSGDKCKPVRETYGNGQASNCNELKAALIQDQSLAQRAEQAQLRQKIMEATPEGRAKLYAELEEREWNSRKAKYDRELQAKAEARAERAEAREEVNLGLQIFDRVKAMADTIMQAQKGAEGGSQC